MSNRCVGRAANVPVWRNRSVAVKHAGSGSTPASTGLEGRLIAVEGTAQTSGPPFVPCLVQQLYRLLNQRPQTPDFLLGRATSRFPTPVPRQRMGRCQLSQETMRVAVACFEALST